MIPTTEPGDQVLPVNYLAARAALAECVRLDECVEWKNMAAALASYAAQAKDDSLKLLADEIHARAVQRLGELLRAIPRPEQGGRPSQNDVGAGIVSRAAAARAAGLSTRQKVTALRVAAIPRAEFERLVTSTKPPTVTQLAALGTVRSAGGQPSRGSAAGATRSRAQS